MIQEVLKLFVFSFVLVTAACSSSTKNSVQEESDKTLEFDDFLTPESKLTEEQQFAFDALNTLQTSTDKMNRLYSTFANTNHPFYPADTSFTISQSELLAFMNQFVSENCQNLSQETRERLVKASVLAQEVYTVMYCGPSSSHSDVKNGIPTSGTWVISNVLGRRDIVLVW